MRRRSRAAGLNPYVVLADVALTMLFILIFALMLQALAGSKAIRQMRREAEQRAVARAVHAAFATEIEERLVRLPTPDGNLQRISFADRILFDSGDDRLKPAGRALLARLAHVLFDHQYRYRAIQVEGHTDDRPIRTARFPSNWELSAARATSVVRFFQAEGIPAERLTASGRAEYHAAAPNRTPAGRAKNRRIEIVLEYSEEMAGMTR